MRSPQSPYPGHVISLRENTNAPFAKIVIYGKLDAYDVKGSERP